MKKKPLIDRLTDEARILRAAHALNDGRTAHAKMLRRVSDLLIEAVMHIAGVEAARKQKGSK